MKIISINRKISTSAVRNRCDAIKIIMQACEFIIENEYKNLDSLDYILTEKKPFIYVDKMYRLFIYEENKLFSIVFPFVIDIEKSEVKMHYRNINRQMLAIINTIFLYNWDELSIERLLEMIWDHDFYKSLEDEDRECLIEAVTHLISYEIGYIRYDYDVENSKKYTEKGKADVHPENHFDINYSGAGTYKIGTNEKVSMEKFLDLLDVTKDCMYIK